jgi:hypothetical protein
MVQMGLGHAISMPGSVSKVEIAWNGTDLSF